MTVIDQVVLIVFRGINFGVLIGIMGYLFKRYGLPTIREQLAAYWAYFQDLANTHRLLKKEQQLVEQSIIAHQKEQDILKERLMRWRARIDELNNQLNIEKEERIAVLKERLLKQQKQIDHHRMFQQIVPLAIAQARNDLEQEARSETMQKKIFDEIMPIMRKQ
jgi:hypothetical protein